MLVRTPSFYRAHVPVAALVAHYTAIADASPVPVLLYNYAAFTGVNMTPETIARLAAHPEHRRPQGNHAPTARSSSSWRPLVPARFSVLAGSAPGAYTAFCAGAAGAILAVACVRPALCLRLRALVARGPSRRGARACSSG